MRQVSVAAFLLAIALVLAIGPEVEGGGGNRPIRLYDCPSIKTAQGSLPFTGFLIAEQPAHARRDPAAVEAGSRFATITLTLVVTGKPSSSAPEETQTFHRIHPPGEVELIMHGHETVAGLSRPRIAELLTIRNPIPAPPARGASFCFPSHGDQQFLTEGWVFVTTVDAVSNAARFDGPSGPPTNFRVIRVSGIVVPTADAGP